MTEELDCLTKLGILSKNAKAKRSNKSPIKSESGAT